MENENSKLDTLQKFNVLALIVFVVSFAVGASEVGYMNMGDNLIGLMLMIFSVSGILILFILRNVFIYLREYRNEK